VNAVVETNDAEKIISRNRTFDGQYEKLRIRAIERAELRERDKQRTKALRPTTDRTETKHYDSGLLRLTEKLGDNMKRLGDGTRITEAQFAAEQCETGLSALSNRQKLEYLWHKERIMFHQKQQYCARRGEDLLRWKDKTPR
jgi:soluble cytochrome b562